MSCVRHRTVVKSVAVLLAVLSGAAALHASGAAEEEAGPARAEYLADKGEFISPAEVNFEEFLSAYDMAYPEPEGAFGVSLYTGQRLISTSGQQDRILIGLQADRTAFETLPPMNIAVAVDGSGSMAARDKMDWIKESLEIFIERVRDKDIVSLVLFDEAAEAAVPAARVGDGDTRGRFRRAVSRLAAEGGSNITAGLTLARQEVLKHYDRDQTNRVLLLTDGWGATSGLEPVLQAYEEEGIGISAVGYGEIYEPELLRQLSKRTGGSSRFVSDAERMEEIFGSGLARMAVPVARDVRIRLELTMQEAGFFGVWGPNMKQTTENGKRVVTFSLPAVHSTDYETMTALVGFPKDTPPGPRAVGRLTVTFIDLSGREQSLDPRWLTYTFMDMPNPVSGASDARVLKADALLQYASCLQSIGSTAQYTTPSGREFFLARDVRRRLLDVQRRLDLDAFASEIEVLGKYLTVVGENLDLKKSIVQAIMEDVEIPATVQDRPLARHMENLFQELALSLEGLPSGAIAASGFTARGVGSAASAAGSAPHPAPLLDYLNQAGEAYLAGLQDPRFPFVERRRLDAVLREQELALSDLSDSRDAVRVGMMVAADYLLTGSVVEMDESVVIFSRIVNVESAVIETAAEVIVPKADIGPGLL